MVAVCSEAALRTVMELEVGACAVRSRILAKAGGNGVCVTALHAVCETLRHITHQISVPCMESILHTEL